MRTTRNIVVSFLAVSAVSAALIGNAAAIDFGGAFGDANGNEPVSPQTQQIQNRKALQQSSSYQLHIAAAEDRHAQNAATQFRNDANGSAKIGFPHR